jgi:hypothetical protein
VEARVHDVDVVLANNDRVTLRVGGTFLKVDADQARLDELAGRLADASDWLVANGVLPPDLVACNRRLAEAALRTWTPAFIHGDLHVEHVFVDGDRVTGIIDWSGRGGRGDASWSSAGCRRTATAHRSCTPRLQSCDRSPDTDQPSNRV